MNFAGSEKRQGIGRFMHYREPMSPDFPIVRPNRDTLYSLSVFDLDAGPMTITLPAAPPDTGMGPESQRPSDFLARRTSPTRAASATSSPSPFGADRLHCVARLLPPRRAQGCSFRSPSKVALVEP